MEAEEEAAEAAKGDREVSSTINYKTKLQATKHTLHEKQLNALFGASVLISNLEG